MTLSTAQLTAAGVRVAGKRTAAGYLARTAKRGTTLERLVMSDQALPGCPVVLANVKQAARRIGGGEVVAVKGPVDFMGTVNGTGRSIVFDAKECALPRFDCSLDKLSQHQCDALIRHGTAMAVSGLLILHTTTEKLYWLGWHRLVTRLPSYTWEEMAPVRRVPRGICWLDVPGVQS